MSKLFFITFLLSMFLIHNTMQAMLIFNQPNQEYTLGTDIISTGTIIYITANGVILNMNTHFIAGGDYGIVIADGVKGVTIQNGKIANINLSGIFIGNNNQSLTFQNLAINSSSGNGITIQSNLTVSLFSNIVMNDTGLVGVSIGPGSQVLSFADITMVDGGDSAFQMLGTGTTTMVSNILIDNLIVASCSLASTSSAVIGVNNGANIVIQDTLIDACGNITGTLAVISLQNCTECLFNNVKLINNSASEIVGIELVNTSSCIFYGTNIISHSAISDGCTGFSLTNTCLKNSFYQCGAFTGFSLTATAIGFDLEAGSNGNFFENCQVNSFIAPDAYGFRFSGSGSPSNTIYNNLDNCGVLRCRGIVGECIGYDINGADSSSIHSGIATDNNALNGVATGMRFTQAGGGNTWAISGCRFARNTGNSDANSYGINVQSGTGNLFIQNFAFNNGGLATNQMAGVPTGSVVELTVNNLNSANEPWSNIVITQ